VADLESQYHESPWALAGLAPRHFKTMRLEDASERLLRIAKACETLEPGSRAHAISRTGNPDADEMGVAPATRGYLLLVEEAERIGMPERYKRDLYVHDRNVLGNQAMLGGSDDPPFVSLLRPSGSEVVALAPYRTNPETLLSHGSITALLHQWEEGCAYYHYTGKTLQRLSDAGAVARVLGRWLNIHGSNPERALLANAATEHTPGFISVNHYKDAYGRSNIGYLVNKSGVDRLRGYRLAYDGNDKEAALSAARKTPGVQLDFVWSNAPNNLEHYQFVPFDVAFGHGAGRTGNPRAIRRPRR